MAPNERYLCKDYRYVVFITPRPRIPVLQSVKVRCMTLDIVKKLPSFNLNGCSCQDKDNNVLNLSEYYFQIAKKLNGKKN